MGSPDTQEKRNPVRNDSGPFGGLFERGSVQKKTPLTSQVAGSRIRGSGSVCRVAGQPR